VSLLHLLPRFALQILSLTIRERDPHFRSSVIAQAVVAVPGTRLPRLDHCVPLVSESNLILSDVVRSDIVSPF
jgi:hypothetical protein